MIRTKEGGVQFEHSLDHALEFFSKAGSLFTKKNSFYEGEESCLSLFQKTWIVDEELSFKLLLWLRDCRGGAGNRSGFRECLRWLAEIDSRWIIANIKWIPEVGRWDDLRILYKTSAQDSAVNLWAEAIFNNNVLAAKWADRKDKPVKHKLGFKEEGKFRKFLAKIRKDHIVEHKMSTHRWNEIDYHTVPSLAMARYTKAFAKKDEERFEKYKERLVSGKDTVHAKVLFPHDCIRTVRYGDSTIADAQFEALPNYMGDEKAIVICDTSGSMNNKITEKIKAVDISQGMALYCSAKIPENNPFYKKFIQFASETKLTDWRKFSFSEAISHIGIFNGAVGCTRIDIALDTILKTATFFNLTQEFMPTMLIIVSDMQFHAGTGYSDPYAKDFPKPEPVINEALNKWISAGYKKPKIVYWNTCGYAGSSETKYGNNIALVSGFSPAILKAIFDGTDLTPIGVMKRALDKYQVVKP
jgi:hypothetical protein